MTTSDQLTEAQLIESVEQWRETMEILCPAVEAWYEAMCYLWEERTEVLLPAVEELVEWWIAYKREMFYCRLRDWHIPHWLARFLAARWPRRWLPEP